MLALALPFLTRNWKLLAAIFLISTAYLYARHQGASGERKAEAARVVKAEAKVVKREAVAGAISDDAGTKLQLARNQIHDLTLKLQARARTDVQAKDDAACRVPPAFGVLYNLAASGDTANLSAGPR